jgi:hypothetical protein
MARFGQGLIASLANPSWADAAGVAGAQLGMLGGKMREERMQSERLNALRGMDEGQRLRYAVDNAKTPEALSEAMANMEEYQKQESIRSATGQVANIRQRMQQIALAQGGKLRDDWDPNALAAYEKLQGDILDIATNTEGMNIPEAAEIGNVIASNVSRDVASALSIQTARDEAQERFRQRQDDEKADQISGRVASIVATGGSIETYIEGLDDDWKAFAMEVYSKHDEYKSRREARRAEAAESRLDVDTNIDIPADLPDGLRQLVDARIANAKDINQKGRINGTWMPNQRRAALDEVEEAERIILDYAVGEVRNQVATDMQYTRTITNFRPNKTAVESAQKEIKDFRNEGVMTFLKTASTAEGERLVRARHAIATANMYGKPVPEGSYETIAELLGDDAGELPSNFSAQARSEQGTETVTDPATGTKYPTTLKDEETGETYKVEIRDGKLVFIDKDGNVVDR